MDEKTEIDYRRRCDAVQERGCGPVLISVAVFLPAVSGVWEVKLAGRVAVRLFELFGELCADLGDFVRRQVGGEGFEDVKEACDKEGAD